MPAIHIGNNHTSASSGQGGAYTYLLVDASALANNTGIINTLYAYWYNYQSGNTVYFGIFYSAGGTLYTCRSATSFLIGGVNLRSYAANLSVVTGDMLGIYWSGGSSLATWTAAPYQSHRMSAIGNKCSVGLTSDFPTLITNGNLRSDGTGTTPTFVSPYNTGGILAGKRLARGMGWMKRSDGLFVPKGGLVHATV